MLPDRETRRISTYENAPLDELLAVVLRQWKRPLAAHNIHLTDTDAAEIAKAIVQHSDDPRLLALYDALKALVNESETLLSGWKLTFAQSLDAEMSDIPGWESTAEFLELAEQKANAELRISIGSALLMAMGDNDYAKYLIAVVERGVVDLDSAIARRVLLFASGMNTDDPDWLENVKKWYTQ